MSYFEFLIIFLLPPIILLTTLYFYDKHRKRILPPEIISNHVRKVILLLVVVAVLYTTPWDNYLIATNLWWYDPNLVTGILIGWVPIEEFIFFMTTNTLIVLGITLACSKLGWMRLERILTFARSVRKSDSHFSSTSRSIVHE